VSGTAAAAAAAHPRRAGGFTARRLAGGAAISCLLGAALIFALVLVAPPLTGHRSLTVLTGSMEPTLETGSVVIAEVIRPTEARVGDVVTFSDPANEDRSITHRLVSVRVEGNTAHMVTRGDANDAGEQWEIALDGEIGRVVYHVPKLGYVRALVGTRGGYVVLTLALLLLGCWVLADIWRPRGRKR
jgi:signal peptidase I